MALLRKCNQGKNCFVNFVLYAVSRIEAIISDVFPNFVEIHVGFGIKYEIIHHDRSEDREDEKSQTLKKKIKDQERVRRSSI